MLLRHFSDGICHLMDEVKSMKQWKIVSAYSTLVFTNVSSTFTACFYNADTQLRKFQNWDKEFTTSSQKTMLGEILPYTYAYTRNRQIFLGILKKPFRYSEFILDYYMIFSEYQNMVFYILNLAFWNQLNFATFDILERFWSNVYLPCC